MKEKRKKERQYSFKDKYGLWPTEGIKYGDMDGRFEGIYDEKGELILRKGEVIMKKLENIIMGVSKGYWVHGGEIILDGSKGPGTVYRTNKRIVFIRKPNWQYQFSGGLLGIPGSIAEAYRAYDLNKMGFYEFFELDLEDRDVEIVSCKEGDLYLKFRGVKYIITLPPEMIEDLRQKYNRKLSFWERWTKAKVEPDF